MDYQNQPADPEKLGESLAALHKRSVSPTGKLGFHVATYHCKIIQAVDRWDDSWFVISSHHLSRIIDIASPMLQWPEFDIVARMTLDKVVPRLLLPLQSDGRVLKPSLVHGDCWDGNTAMDAAGEALIFDVCSFYGHNEYDTGNWRAPRHRLNDEAYIRNYKRHFPVSEPGTCARGARSSACGTLTIYLQSRIGMPETCCIPCRTTSATQFMSPDQPRDKCMYMTTGLRFHSYTPSTLDPVADTTLLRYSVYEDMTSLCKMFYADDLRSEMEKLRGA